MRIYYFNEDCEFILKEKSFLKNIFLKIEELEQRKFSILNIIFCSDKYLQEINIKYLNRNYLTDIITFPYLEKKISGDLFISIDRIKENAELFKVSIENELHRVLIHGVLHLCGYDDNTEEEKAHMREKEDYYMNILS